MNDLHGAPLLAAQVEELGALTHRFVAILDQLTESADASRAERAAASQLLAQFTAQVDAFRQSERLTKDVQALGHLVERHQALHSSLVNALRTMIQEQVGELAQRARGRGGGARRRAGGRGARLLAAAEPGGDCRAAGGAG